jgi:hypothetical protein
MKSDEQIWRDIYEKWMDDEGDPSPEGLWDQSNVFAEWLASNYYPPALKSGGEELPE